MTLGQHTQDPHFSFYHFSPSGFAVEVIAETHPWPGDPFELNAERLDVNEQNPQALGFYLHEGFEVIGRSETDGLGQPYPLLHMKLIRTAS